MEAGLTTGEPLIHRLGQSAPGPAAIGGLGDAQSRLAEAGFPVPGGFCLTTEAYGLFLAANGLGPVITALTSRLDPQDRAAVERVAGIVGTGIEAGDIPGRLAGQIREAYAELSFGSVAVQLSPTVDERVDQVAGLTRSNALVAHDLPDLLEAIRSIWARLWSSAAVRARAERGALGQPVLAGIVVSRLINSEASGQMTTVDPVTGLDSAAVIDANWGLSIGNRASEANTDRFMVDRRSGRLLKQRTATKEMMVVGAGSGSEFAAVPANLRTRPSLNKSQAVQLARLGRNVDALFQRPMEVEWCRIGAQLWIVGARPALGRRTDPWNDSYRGDFLWTNTVVSEVIPDVVTPVSWSVIQIYLAEAMAMASIPPYIAYGRIGGHIYFNVSVLAALGVFAGVGEARFRLLSDEIFSALDPTIEIPPVPAPRSKVVAAVVPTGLGLRLRAPLRAWAALADVSGHAQLCDRRREQISQISSPERLAQLWRVTLEPEFREICRQFSAVTRGEGTTLAATHSRLAALVGTDAATALTKRLTGTYGRRAGRDLVAGLDRVANGELDDAGFAAAYGHRGPHEFELSWPRPLEDPNWQSAVQQNVSEAELAAVARRRRLAASQRQQVLDRLHQDHRLQGRVLHRQLERWERIASRRDQLRSESIRYFWVLRAFVVKAGELTELGDDIYFLELGEILNALAGDPLDAGEISRRRRAHRDYASLPSLPSLIRGRFDPVSWATAERTDAAGEPA